MLHWHSLGEDAVPTDDDWLSTVLVRTLGMEAGTGTLRRVEVCAVGQRGPIGFDLELDEPRSAAFVRDHLMWSAKESALKVVRTGLLLDDRTGRTVPGQSWDDPTAFNHPCCAEPDSTTRSGGVVLVVEGAQLPVWYAQGAGGAPRMARLP